MAYLLISVACSVLVSVLLKLMQRRGIDTAQGITWNYLAASLLCFGLLDPPLAALGHRRVVQADDVEGRQAG